MRDISAEKLREISMVTRLFKQLKNENPRMVPQEFESFEADNVRFLIIQK